MRGTQRNDILTLTACFLGIALWAFSVAGVTLVGFTISHGPMLGLSLAFWASYLIILGASIFARGPIARLVSLAAMLCVTTLTIALIAPYGYLIDSAWNVSYSSTLYQTGSLASVPHPYVSSYPGSFVLYGALMSSTGLEGFTFIRYFVIISSSLTFLGIYALAREVRRRIIKSNDSGFEYFTTLLAMIFGAQFFLRINPAPETVAYILSLFVLLLTLKSGSKASLLVILCIGTITIAHLLTPFLLLPILFVFTLWRPLGHSLSFAITRVVLVLSAIMGWLIFRSEWIMAGALALLLRSAGYEIESARQAFPPVSLAPLYYYFYISALAVLLVLVVSAIGLSRKTRFGRGIGASIAVMAPWGLSLFGGELMPRLQLTMLVPVILAVAWLSSRHLTLSHSPWATPSRRQRLAAWTFLAVLVAAGMSSVASSYYALNAYERITDGTYAAQKFMSAMGSDSKSYVDGFAIPVDWTGSPEISSRNVFRIPGNAALVVVTDQIRNFASLYQGQPYSKTHLFAMESSLSATWNVVYNNGQGTIYLKPTADYRP